MRKSGLLLLLASGLLLAGCAPRLARYGGAADAPASPSAGASGSFGPVRGGDLSKERLLAFMAVVNPRLDAGLASLEADWLLHHAAKEGVPPALLAGLVATESSFNPRAVSPHGAQGLGQLMPPTARELGVTDPFDVAQNLGGTARYLAKLRRAWADHPEQDAMALASYFAGIGTLTRQAKRQEPLTAAQAGYVKRVMGFSERV